MSVIGIIGAVVGLIIYIAQSVEKQNAQERKRRQRQRRKQGSRSARHAPDVQTARSQVLQHEITADASSDLSADQNTRMKKYGEAMERMGRNAAIGGPAGSRIEIQRPGAGRISRPAIKGHDTLREAFIFAECIGKPRALSPHRFFSRSAKR